MSQALITRKDIHTTWVVDAAKSQKAARKLLLAQNLDYSLKEIKLSVKKYNTAAKHHPKWLKWLKREWTSFENKHRRPGGALHVVALTPAPSLDLPANPPAPPPAPTSPLQSSPALLADSTDMTQIDRILVAGSTRTLYKNPDAWFGAAAAGNFAEGNFGNMMAADFDTEDGQSLVQAPYVPVDAWNSIDNQILQQE